MYCILVSVKNLGRHWCSFTICRVLHLKPQGWHLQELSQRLHRELTAVLPVVYFLENWPLFYLLYLLLLYLDGLLLLFLLMLLHRLLLEYEAVVPGVSGQDHSHLTRQRWFYATHCSGYLGYKWALRLLDREPPGFATLGGSFAPQCFWQWHRDSEDTTCVILFLALYLWCRFLVI